MIGKQLAHYEITDLLGKGGMGEVYRARDTKLDRQVALKLLPAELTGDPERLARFEREAKVLASLSHPNIAGIFGLEQDGDTRFLVMELAEGIDLTERIAMGAVPPDEVAAIAKQLARGLEQAHERGIVHRDLKPANIKLGPDGQVKILDFGLARAYQGESLAEGDMAHSPTITAAMTQAGTILGTAAYMSPEQARGMEVDRRADIWAFGVILHEMLTATRLFEGETLSDTLAGVLKTEPDLDALPEDTPPALRWLVERCLKKKPAERLRDIGEARVLLEGDLSATPTGSGIRPGVVLVERPRWVVPALAGIALVALAAGGLLGRSSVPAPAPPRALHAALLSPAGQQLWIDNGHHPIISPDGTRVAFVASDSNDLRQLWVRRLDRPAAHLLSGTEGASYPFWSHDGERIAFFANGRLRKIDAAGGVATTICEASDGRGGCWLPDDRIVLSQVVQGPLSIVPAAGGSPVAISATDTTTFSHRFPSALPGGGSIVFVTLGDKNGLRWMRLDGSEARPLLEGTHRAAFADGHLFYGQGGSLWARPFDPGQGEWLGEAVLVAENVVSSNNFGSDCWSVAQDGTLALVSGKRMSSSPIVTRDRGGRELDRFLLEGDGASDPALSPDGRYLALAILPGDSGTGSDIWIRDMQRGVLTRFTTDELADDPAWGPLGDRLAYQFSGGIRIRSTVGARELLGEIPMGDDTLPHCWTPDGQALVVTRVGTGRNIWVLPVDDPTAAYPLVEDNRTNVHPDVSPDGRWLCYMAVDGNEPQIYLREMARDGGTWQVTAGFGIMPRFNRDGSAIFYRDEEGLMSVPVELSPGRAEFGKDERVLLANFRGGRSNNHFYTVAPNDSVFTFLASTSNEGFAGDHIELVQNWRGVLGAR